MNIKELFKVTSIPVVIASLCCLAPVILVLVGLSTVSFAASLSDTLYGEYKWWFRGVGLVLLFISAGIYMRLSRGICTIDDVKKRRNEVINIVSVVFIAGVIGYIVWLYGVVEIFGLILGIW